MSKKAKSAYDRVIPRLKPHRSCLLWTGAAHGSQYSVGVVTVMVGKKKTTSAPARVVWEKEKGAIPPGMMVLHSCKNGLCCNINHLFLGTNDDRIRMQRKHDRFAKGPRHSAAMSGEVSFLHKLTWKSVRGIRFAVDTGKYTTEEAAKLWGVSRRTIQNIISNQTWKEEYDPLKIDWQKAA